MNHNQKFWIEQTLRKLPFVKWDRFTQWEFEDIELMRVFGWIDRESDSYKDFVVLEFDLTAQFTFFVCTSSAKHSAEISRIIEGMNGSHIDCQRVEYKFSIPNVVKEAK